MTGLKQELLALVPPGLSFKDPLLLLLLLVVPLAVLLKVLRERRGDGALVVPTVAFAATVRPSWRVRLRHLPFALTLLAFAGLVVALARPRLGLERTESWTEGVDIFIALDASGSMAAEDFKPKNRFVVAKNSVRQFIEGRRTDRVGLLVFAGRSRTVAPLTTDRGMVLERLQALTLGDQGDGTAIGMALINACNRLRESRAKSQVIILLTDGVNNAGEIEPLTAADVAAAVGIRIYAIGVGSEGAIRRPVHGFFGTRYQTVHVEMDEKTLQQVAERTGGRYYRATSERKLEEIYSEIGRLETSPVQSRVHVDYSERYAWFLWPGLLLLVGEAVLSSTRFRRLP